MKINIFNKYLKSIGHTPYWKFLYNKNDPNNIYFNHSSSGNLLLSRLVKYNLFGYFLEKEITYTNIDNK